MGHFLCCGSEMWGLNIFSGGDGIARKIIGFFEFAVGCYVISHECGGDKLCYGGERITSHGNAGPKVSNKHLLHLLVLHPLARVGQVHLIDDVAIVELPSSNYLDARGFVISLPNHKL